MSSHCFGARVYVIRHYALRWSRDKLARKLVERGHRLPLDDSLELREVTRDEIKRWERGESEPSYVTKRHVAIVLRIRHEILDPEEHPGDISPEGLVALARARGLTPPQINQYWTLTKQRALFKGNPGIGEWISIIEQLSIAEQGTLFTSGTWCTHCGGWIEDGDAECPDCGNIE
ncbi:MAG: hypothetical protein WD379_04155 [Dehalococcoidia bacterium]